MQLKEFIHGTKRKNWHSILEFDEIWIIQFEKDQVYAFIEPERGKFLLVRLPFYEVSNDYEFSIPRHRLEEIMKE